MLQPKKYGSSRLQHDKGEDVYFQGKQPTLMCLSIGTPTNNKFSICSKWKIHYF